jgi:phospholipase/carboxylesterase
MSNPRLAGGGGGLVYRWRAAIDPDDPCAILLHGRTGDETVMWVVADALPSNGLMAAPRAPFPSPDGGYSWQEPHAARTTLDEFGPGVTALRGLLDTLADERSLDRGKLMLVGFSQGSALAFAAAREQAIRPLGIVALAGFLPDGDAAHLRGIPIFWGHGTRDTLVPIERARADVERLRQIGAEVQFCEADVDHRVGVECMRGLKHWWVGHFPATDGTQRQGRY